MCQGGEILTKNTECVNVVKTRLLPILYFFFCAASNNLGSKAFVCDVCRFEYEIILSNFRIMRAPFRFISVRSPIIGTPVVQSCPERRCHFCQISVRTCPLDWNSLAFDSTALKPIWMDMDNTHRQTNRLSQMENALFPHCGPNRCIDIHCDSSLTCHTALYLTKNNFKLCIHPLSLHFFSPLPVPPPPPLALKRSWAQGPGGLKSDRC